jgi:PAS domain S-box-containing protein
MGQPELSPDHRPTWLKPWVIAVGLGAAAGLVVLNFAAALFGPEQPWLTAVDLVADLAVLGAGIFAVVRLGLLAETQAAQARTAIDESHARLSAIVDSAMDAVITVDESQKIVLFNRAAEQVFRCRKDEVLGGPLERLLPERFRAAHGAHIERFGRTSVTSRKMGATTTLWGLRADGGGEFPVEAAISQVLEGGRRYYTVILRDITQRKLAQDTMQRQQTELRALSTQVLEAREEEKTRIARELHDELGQQLTALKMDLSWLRERLEGAPPEAASKAQSMERLLDSTVGSMRRISADLRPLMLDDLGLLDALNWLVDDFAKRSGLSVQLELPADEALPELPRELAVTVYRALQESLTNIARHAGAKNAWAVLSVNGEWIRLEVEDDGRGIAPEDLEKARSLGLKGLRERAAHIGGTAEVSRAPRGGTRLRVRLPLRRDGGEGEP